MRLSRKSLKNISLAALCVGVWSMSNASVAAAACGDGISTDYPKKIAAFKTDCTNLAPRGVINEIHDDIANAGYSVSYSAWLSPVGNPTGSSVTVDAGTSSVALQLNVLTYRRASSTTQWFRRHILTSNSDLAGRSHDVVYPSSVESYRIMSPIRFTIALNPAIKNDTLYTVTTTQKAINSLSSHPNYKCVFMMAGDPNGGRAVRSVDDYGSCSLGNSSLAITIRIRSAWRTGATTRLYANAGTGFTLRARDGNTTPQLPAGTTVYWDHALDVRGTVKNETYNITYHKDNRVGVNTVSSANSTWRFGLPGVTLISPSPSLTTAIAGTYSASRPFTALSSDVGKTICERVVWSPSARSGGVLNNSWSGSSPTCFTVTLDYELTPFVSVDSTIANPSGSVKFSYSVKNSAGSMGTRNTVYMTRQVTIAPGATLPASFFAQKDGTAGCSAYTMYAGVTCRDGLPGSQSFAQGPSTTPVGSEAVSTAYVPGTRVCRALSVAPRNASQDPTQNRDSALVCVLIAASPYLTAVGGTVWAGGSVTSPYNTVAGFHGMPTTAYGSFGDYGVFATGSVDFFGSAGTLGRSETASGMANGPLTFANTAQLGRFMTMHQITDQSLQYNQAPHVPGVIRAAGVVSGSGVFKASGNMTLNASTLTNGIHAVVYAPHYTVTVRGDITYNSAGAGSFANVPSLTIIAKDLVIDKAVQRIDANIFITTGTFVTCSQGPAAVLASGAYTVSGECSKKLTINGAVASGGALTKLVFNRSYGGNAAGEPAEMIRMRPEVFLTPYDYAQQNSTMLTTVSETELPTRW